MRIGSRACLNGEQAKEKLGHAPLFCGGVFDFKVWQLVFYIICPECMAGNKPVCEFIKGKFVFILMAEQGVLVFGCLLFCFFYCAEVWKESAFFLYVTGCGSRFFPMFSVNVFCNAFVDCGIFGWKIIVVFIIRKKEF